MSVKDRVNSLVSDTRRAYTKTPILEANDPTPQTRIGSITYNELSEILTGIAVATVENGSKFVNSNRQKLLDALFLSPRLTQWEKSKYPNGYAQWRIYAKDDSIFVIVSNNIRSEGEGEFHISLHKGEKRNWDISKGLPVQSLWQALEQAQPIVTQATEEQELMTDEEQQSYFEDDTYHPSAGLDEALADTHVEPLSADDAELIEDVTTEKALDEDQHKLDGPEPIVTVSQAFIDDIQAKQYVGKTTGYVDAEVARVKEEYPELKDKILEDFSKLKQGSGWTNFDRSDAMQHLKSLQGRILTIMDASIGDKEQRAAVKTLINKEFRRELTKLNGKEQSEE